MVNDFERSKERLLKELKIMGINNHRVLDAIKSVPREEFVLENMREHAYDNEPLPLQYGQTISQPYIVALMLQELELKENHKVLEIGTGSGYQTALLSYLGTNVFSLERIYCLFLTAKKRLKKLNYNAKLYYLDGKKGLETEAPFDRIIVSAATPEIPKALEEQINHDDGIIIVPVGYEEEPQILYKIKYEKNKKDVKKLTYCRFVPLK
ncbi:MAG TPA: protein-L-isoaspartate(D-aspartate) O-methyltransferase [Spirochaetota bacterium]|nr:protein-L-isoaspartate(D-aspartate) O-methyltransferase [Spirochaetota bacterium]HOM38400.1 protein-L-isoaspartate(D-aspartate) O-methyltransferase [Spirochaetota bacterium]HPQ48382.1 protein-L-isoaspartate(D-aspartate) O-methyltransferase [Spirochaetota bacterium]